MDRPKDSSGFSNEATRSHSKQIVKTMERRLHDEVVDFQAALERRKSNMGAQAARKSKFLSRGVDADALGAPLVFTPFVPPPSSSEGSGDGRAEAVGDADEDGSLRRRPVATSSRGGGFDESQNLLSDRTQEQQQLLPDQSYLQSRADAMSNVEGLIHELGGVMRTLAGMIAEQGEAIEDLEGNVVETHDNVVMGQRELLRYMRSLASNRQLSAKLFGVFFVFAILFIVFFA